MASKLGMCGSEDADLIRVSCHYYIFRSTSPSRPNKVGLKCPSSHLYDVCPCTKRFFDFNEICYVGKGR